MSDEPDVPHGSLDGSPPIGRLTDPRRRSCSPRHGIDGKRVLQCISLGCQVLPTTLRSSTSSASSAPVDVEPLTDGPSEADQLLVRCAARAAAVGEGFRQCQDATYAAHRPCRLQEATSSMCIPAAMTYRVDSVVPPFHHFRTRWPCASVARCHTSATPPQNEQFLPEVSKREPAVPHRG